MFFSPEDIFLLSSSVFVLQQCVSLNKSLKNKSVLKSHKKLLSLALACAVLQFLFITFAVLNLNRTNDHVTSCTVNDGSLIHGAPIYAWIVLNLFVLSIVEDLNRKYPTGRAKAAKSLSVIFMTLMSLLGVLNLGATYLLNVSVSCARKPV